MSIVMSEDKREACKFEPEWYRAAREAEASEFLRDDDYIDDGGMEMLGRLIAVAVAFAVVGCILAVMA